MTMHQVPIGTVQRYQTLVLKFGGTSVRDATAMRNVVSITNREAQRPNSNAPRPIVITSACAGITDRLLECARAAGERRIGDAQAITREIRDRHIDILRDLGDNADGSTERQLLLLLDEISRLVEGVRLLGELTPRTIDLFASYGEGLSSVLLCRAFVIDGWRASLADSRRLIITDERHTEACPIMDEIDRVLPAEIYSMLDGSDVVVAQGFIGSSRSSGATTTIGRGGSDHSGALYGAALRSQEIQIWTDVSGILTADPRIVPSARVVPEITFTEARELAFFGARVIHPDTIIPAVSRGIAVVIRNSLAPQEAGTRILPDGSAIPAGLHSITMRGGITFVEISPLPVANVATNVDAHFSLFSEHGVGLLFAQFAESRAVAAIRSKDWNDLLRADLESVCTVIVHQDMAILCLCGDGLLDHPEILSPAVEALAGAQTAFIAVGSSDHVLLVGLHESQATETLARVHGCLFG